MTSEVVIMNRRAIAIAADSAVTVTSTQGGRREQKYYKGANKVFELSNRHPVALMIFDSAELHSVPWEIIIKSYRDHIGDNSFRSLDDYANDFFSYVQNHSQIFPGERQEELFFIDCVTAAFDLVSWLVKQPDVTAAPDAAAKGAAIDSVFTRTAEEIEGLPLPDHFSTNTIEDTVDKYGHELEDKLGKGLPSISPNIDIKIFIRTIVGVVFKQYRRYLSHTGIVIAGYGDQAYFPGFVQYDCYGILLGKVLADKVKEKYVTVDDGSAIEPFAMNDMVQTFMLGLSPDIFSVVTNGLDAALDELGQKVGIDLGLPSVPNFGAHKQTCSEKFKDQLASAQVEEHYLPLTRAVASLPIDEMASLAESLIMLESLKEKVTRPSESVGGPVDVAVITKSEGLVWIRRKHYFPSDLNSRFMERQRQRLK